MAARNDRDVAWPSAAARRAASAARRGRHAERRRWIVAAVYAARRRGAVASTAAAAGGAPVGSLVDALLEEGAFPDARWLVEALWRRAADPRERVPLAALGAHVALASGRLAAVEPWAAQAASMAACLGWTDPALRDAAVARVWRTGQCAAHSTEARALAVWVTGEGPTTGEAGVWRAEAEPLGPEGARREDGEGAATSAVWMRAAEAQRALEARDDTRARAIANGRVRPRRRRGLADLALSAVRAALGVAGRGERRWLAAWLRDERPAGWARWGRREPTMTQGQPIAELLTGIRDAPTDGDALALVAAWVGREANGRVAIAGRDGRVVAGLPWAALGVDTAQVARALAAPAGVVAGPAGSTGDDGRVIVWATVTDGPHAAGVIAVAPQAWRTAIVTDALAVAAAVAGPHLVRAARAAAPSQGLERAIIGVSPAIDAVRLAAARAAAVPFAAVIEGESGTGKELVARAVHQLGPRARQPFIAINCAAVPDELAEAELFGHAKGAFTHAVTARAGLFEEAHRGTLFLDEVSELTSRAQAKLLRVLQEGEVRRVGETAARPVDVRVVAASNRPLETLVAAGRFREDLYFRLRVIRLRLPPLRERAEDIPMLAEAFWNLAARTAGTRATLGADALAALTAQPWPGNVRHLQNAVSALAVAAPAAGRVTAALVATVLGDAEAPDGAASLLPLEHARRDVERRMVAAALSRHPARADAARALGLSRQGLAKALRRLGLTDRRGAGVA